LSQLGLENIVNNQKQLSSSLSKLSSGLRITSASDDASGLAIADKLRTQASGIKQATSNANSAIAFAQIGDKAMSEQSSILDFVKQKLIQSATDTTSDDGRQMILNDIKKSLTQYDSIASSTNYNGITILQKNSNDQGESPIHTFQVGDSPEDIVSIEVVQANTSFGGGTQIDTLNISGDIKEKDIFTVTVNGIPVSYVANSSDVGSTGDKHNQIALGLKSEIESNSQLSNLITVENTSDGVLKFTSKNDGGFFNVNPGTITLNTDITNTFSGLSGAVAQKMTYSLSGTVEKGDTYTVGSVSYTVQGSDTSMNNIIDKLVQGLNGTGGGVVGLTVTSTLSGATASRNSSGNLVLTANTAGVPFTPPSFSTTNIPSVNDQVITSNEIQANVQEVVASPEVLEEKVFSLQNTAVVEAGDKYDLNIDGKNISYTVKTTDSTKSDIINGLYNLLINDSSLSYINFTNEGNDIRMTAIRNFNVTTSSYATTFIVPLPSTITNTTLQNNETGQSAYYASTTQTLTYDTRYGAENSDNFQIGDTITFNYGNGDTLSYTVLAEDYSTNHNGFTTAMNVFTKLTNLINSDSRFNSNITASVDSTDWMGVKKEAKIIIKAKDVGLYHPTAGSSSTIFTSNDIILNQNHSVTGVSISGSYSTPDVPPVQSLQEITKAELSGTILTGSVFAIKFSNNTDSLPENYLFYAAQSGDDFDSIKNGLLNTFNSSSLATKKVYISDGISESLIQVNQYDVSVDASGNLILKSYIDSTKTGLYNYQNNGYTSYVYSNSNSNDLVDNITAYKLGTANFTPKITSVSTYSAEVFPVTPQSQQTKYTLSGTVEPGDKYTVGNVTYTVQPTDTSIGNIVDKLIIGLNGGTATGLSGTSTLSGVTASKDASGMLLLTADISGTPFTAPAFQTINVVTSNNQNISLINTINNVTSENENKYSISGFINEGNTYNIGGAIYTAQSGDTIEDVIDGLVNSVNGNSIAGVSGTPISGVVAIKTPPPIQISIKPSINFTISANVDLSNLTASELKNDLSINSNNVVTLNSSNGKYSTYTEDSTINYNDETQNIDTQNLQSVNSLSGLKNLDYLTVDIAKRYMTIVDDNLTALNTFRGSFGSAQNQLESASRNLMTQYTNIKSAESVIRDVDYAEESTNFNRLNIVGQGTIYAQSKANERKQDIIRLLQS
jgi:flagellin-like hook-associated protein FlgL